MTSLWLDRHPAITTDEWRPVSGVQPDVVVVGAGITGLATALMLQRAGRRVLVLEGRTVGAGATGNTTAKVSLLHGDVLQRVRQHNSARVLRAYVTGNQAGQQWLRQYLGERQVPFQVRDAITYATTTKGQDVLRRELRACREAGLEVEEDAVAGLPFPVRCTIRLRDQFQIDPMTLLAAMVEDLRAAGGQLVEGVRVLGADPFNPSKLRTTEGDLTADRLVLATGVPILDRGLYFAKLEAIRSYALAFRLPADTAARIPRGMYLSVDDQTRSLRDADEAAQRHLLVGGNGHPVGRCRSPQAMVDDLVEWTHRYWPDAELTHRWSAQDYRSDNCVPFVGTLPRSGGRAYVATGYDKWGMTNGIAAALDLTAQITGSPPDWAAPLRHRVTRPRDLLTGGIANAKVGYHMAKAWGAAVSTQAVTIAPAEGDGRVGRSGMLIRATCTVDGVTRTVSGVCPHLGGVLTWNDAEKSWDCPLHGSRFAPDGNVLEGPATRGLPSLGEPDGR